VTGGAVAGVEEGDEPKPIKDRGVWFDGTDDYFTLQGLNLYQTHTFTSWNRIIGFGTVLSSFRSNIINTRFVEFSG
jgi:hypothetical protein